MSEKAPKLPAFIARTLTEMDPAENPYRRVLGTIAKMVGADMAFARRTSETGGIEIDEYTAAQSETDEVRGKERERRLGLLRAAAAASEEKNEDAETARKTIGEEGWAVIQSTGGGAKSETEYLIALAADSGKNLHPLTENAVTSALEIIEPIFRTRIALARREIERRQAEAELRSSEEELRRFFADSKDMIYTVNAEDRIASINDSGVSLLGLSSRFDIIGKPFSDFALNPEDRTNFLSRIRKDGFVRDYEIVIKQSGTEPRFCVETAHAERTKDGTIVSVRGIVKDISERIKNEKALWMANLELAETNERLQATQMVLVQQEKLASIGQLAAGIAHEINNPLGFLRSNFKSLKEFTSALERIWTAAKSAIDPKTAELIEKKEDVLFIQEELPQIYQECEDGFKRIVEIVSQLKTFSRIDTEAKMAPYSLEQGIDSTLVVAANEIKFVADVKKEFAGVPEVDADGGSINQVLLNVLVNAAQAIASQKRKDRGLITVSTRENGDYCYCSITDDGPGMPEDVRKRVFDPFFTTKEPGKGTGLGLSISYDIIVNKHGGKISVRSAPGAGATFELGLLKKPLPRT